MNKQLSLVEVSAMDERKAEEYFVSKRWPNGVRCPRCRSSHVNVRANRNPMPYYCGKCRKYFSVRTRSLMANSRLPLRTWAIAFYLMSTRPKGISSRQLCQDLGITQKTAWYLAHRIRDALDVPHGKRAGPVEVDETYVGGLNKNRHLNKRLRNISGTAGKTPVIGMLDRPTNQVHAEVISTTTTRNVLQQFVRSNTLATAILYTDDHAGYRGARLLHFAVNHSRGSYVRGNIHTNGIESFWAVAKRAYKGTYHWWSLKHLQRYMNEFAGRHNMQALSFADRLERVFLQSLGKQLPYAQLIK